MSSAVEHPWKLNDHVSPQCHCSGRQPPLWAKPCEDFLNDGRIHVMKNGFNSSRIGSFVKKAERGGAGHM